MSADRRFALDYYSVDYEQFGQVTELKQVEIIREVRKLRELAKTTVRSHFDHESYWTDGRNFYLLVNFTLSESR